MRLALRCSPCLVPWPVLWLTCACAGSGTQSKQPAPAHAASQVEPTAPAAAASVAAQAARADHAAPAAGADALTVTGSAVPALPVEATLAPEVNAGVIARGALEAVLAQGVGRFLRSVRAEPDVIKGHFAGWRVMSLFADAPAVHVQVLRPGDTVRRANGQSIEHPEEFQAVWDSLGTARELVLDIERAGKPSKLRYAIAD